MRRSCFSVEQIMAVLKQDELGIAVPELIRKVGISKSTFYRRGLALQVARRTRANRSVTLYLG